MERSSKTSNPSWLGIALMALGLLFLFGQFGWFSVGRLLGLLWPLLLIFLGWTLYRQNQEAAGGEDGAVLSRASAFGDFRLQSAAQNLRSVKIWSLFGDGIIDLSQARLEPGATLDLVALFGDMRVIVPAGTTVDCGAWVLAGEFEVPAADGEAGTVLRVSGVSLFGDLRFVTA